MEQYIHNKHYAPCLLEGARTGRVCSKVKLSFLFLYLIYQLVDFESYYFYKKKGMGYGHMQEISFSCSSSPPTWSNNTTPWLRTNTLKTVFLALNPVSLMSSYEALNNALNLSIQYFLQQKNTDHNRAIGTTNQVIMSSLFKEWTHI